MKKILFLLFALFIIACDKENTNQPVTNKKYRADVIENGQIVTSLHFNGNTKLSFDQRYFSRNFGKGFPGAFTQVQLSQLTEIPMMLIYMISATSNLGACTEIESFETDGIEATFEYDAAGYLKKMSEIFMGTPLIIDYIHQSGKISSKSIAGIGLINFVYDNQLIIGSPELGIVIDYDENGYPTEISSEDAQVTISYSSDYRTVIITDSNDQSIYSVEGNKITKVIASDYTNFFTYDSSGRLTKIEHIDAATTTSTITTITYTEIK